MNYHAQATKNIVATQFADISVIYPTPKELFDIIEIAFNKKDLIGCHQNQDDIASNFGIFSCHQYVLSGVGKVKDLRYVKVHNPHNTADELKK
jgi:hypothetical protein